MHPIPPVFARNLLLKVVLTFGVGLAIAALL